VRTAARQPWPSKPAKRARGSGRSDFQMFINISICLRPELSESEIYFAFAVLAVLGSHRQTN
jgi:hypothetical protein